MKLCCQIHPTIWCFDCYKVLCGDCSYQHKRHTFKYGVAYIATHTGKSHLKRWVAFNKILTDLQVEDYIDFGWVDTHGGPGKAFKDVDLSIKRSRSWTLVSYLDKQW